jgi:hypothetical protein
MNVHLTDISSNKKTGRIPVSTSTADWCPDSCPLKEAGCYAKHSHLGMHWKKVTSGERGTDWNGFTSKIRKLPKHGIWRHNQAGDLPVDCDRIDSIKMRQLIAANRGKGGFTYTHHNPFDTDNAEIILESNHGGFTVNLSADTTAKADTYVELGIAPVVTLLPTDSAKVTYTPKGRKIVRCPAETSAKVTCQSCRLCQKVNRPIIGFTPHGSGRKSANVVATGA